MQQTDRFFDIEIQHLHPINKELIMKQTINGISIGLISTALLGAGFSALAASEANTPAAPAPTPAVSAKDNHVKNSASRWRKRRSSPTMKSCIRYCTWRKRTQKTHSRCSQKQMAS
jgi:hypothetical protein